MFPGILRSKSPTVLVGLLMLAVAPAAGQAPPDTPRSLAAAVAARRAQFATEPHIADIPPFRHLFLLRETSLRVDRLQAAHDRLLPPTSGLAWVDRVDVRQFFITETEFVWTIEVDGWAFTCDDAQDRNHAHVAIVVDDIETGDWIWQHDRPDVRKGLPGYCSRFGGGQIPTAAGAFTLTDMTVFGSGLTGNGTHLVKFRIYDAAGRAKDSANTIEVVVPFR